VIDDGARWKLRAALAECSLHADILAQALTLAPPQFGPADVAAVGAETRRVLDQLAFRYMKLQDSLGEKVLPGLLGLSLDPLPDDTPFVQKLNRLERLGLVPSAAGWKTLREVRNTLAHEYPDHPDLQAAAWTRLLLAARDLLLVWQAARDGARRLAPES
jgi:hypothetical protein